MIAPLKLLERSALKLKSWVGYYQGDCKGALESYRNSYCARNGPFGQTRQQTEILLGFFMDKTLFYLDRIVHTNKLINITYCKVASSDCLGKYYTQALSECL